MTEYIPDSHLSYHVGGKHEHVGAFVEALRRCQVTNSLFQTNRNKQFLTISPSLQRQTVASHTRCRTDKQTPVSQREFTKKNT